MVTTFYCIADTADAGLRELFRFACLQRDVDFQTVRTRAFDFAAPTTANADDVMYQVSLSPLANLVASRLAAAAVNALDMGSPHQPMSDDDLLRGAVPSVASVPCNSRNRASIGRAVESVGGLPVVVKVPGGEGGVGVMIAESYRSLFSLLDYLDATGVTPSLSRFISGATHWRCIVLGDKVIASYANEPLDNDFRTVTSDHAEAYEQAAPADAQAIAQAAALAIGVEFAGVDVLTDRSGASAVLEVNAPCNFEAVQTIGGVDISGAIVERLLAKLDATARHD